MSNLVLALNPGNTSTKAALFRDAELVREETVRHGDDELKPFARIFDQKDLRAAALGRFVDGAGVKRGELQAVVGRGGLLRPLASGTYAVNAAMIEDLQKAARGEHASNLGAAIAAEIAAAHGCPAFIVDPVSVDEMDDVARPSGLAGVERQSRSHALNMKAVARRHARTVGRSYPELRLVVVHMGSGVSLSAHAGGRMIDIVNPQDEGPFSPDRCGGVPATALVALCFEKGAEPRGIKKRLMGDGGLYSYFKSRDMKELLGRAEKEPPVAVADATFSVRLVLDAMCYQIAKSIGEMSVALRGQVDAILLTGGIAYNEPINAKIRERVEWIAKVHVYPGEDELPALAEGALRVLRGEEKAKEY